MPETRYLIAVTWRCSVVASSDELVVQVKQHQSRFVPLVMR
jgi:hypothetical protein